MIKFKFKLKINEKWAKNAQKTLKSRYFCGFLLNTGPMMTLILYFIKNTFKIQSLNSLDILINCIKSIKDSLFHHKRPKIAVRAINHP